MKDNVAPLLHSCDEGVWGLICRRPDSQQSPGGRKDSNVAAEAEMFMPPCFAERSPAVRKPLWECIVCSLLPACMRLHSTGTISSPSRSICRAGRNSARHRYTTTSAPSPQTRCFRPGVMSPCTEHKWRPRRHDVTPRNPRTALSDASATRPPSTPHFILPNTTGEARFGGASPHTHVILTGFLHQNKSKIAIGSRRPKKQARTNMTHKLL